MKLLSRKLFFVSLFLALGLILLIAASFLITPKVVEIAPPLQRTITPIEKEEIRIILVGDIMLDRGVEYMINKEGEGDFKFPFLKIADYLKTADIVFGNLEGMISDKGIKVGSIYSFRIKPEAIEGLKFAGFNVLSLANNHAFDYTRAALEDCLNRLAVAQIQYVGAGFTEEEAFSSIIKEIKGAKVGFLAYTNLGPEAWRARGESSGIAWISEVAERSFISHPRSARVDDFEKIKKDIENAKAQADILIVSLHAGEEYQKTPAQFQIDFSRMAIDAGADVVVGHHPHVVQSNEIYNGGYIFYSLGNFIFDQSFSEETMRGQIVEVLIENGKIKEVNPINIKINNFFQPEIEK